LPRDPRRRAHRLSEELRDPRAAPSPADRARVRAGPTAPRRHRSRGRPHRDAGSRHDDLPRQPGRRHGGPRGGRVSPGPPLDARRRLPTIDSSWDEMRATHIPPFVAAVAEGVDCLMTSHPVYPNLDPARIPATFSRRIVHDHLRVEMGFSGVIVSDDLEMGAIGEACPIGEAVVKTAAAGHDLLLVCHTEPAQRAAARALVDAYLSGALPVRDLEAAAGRVGRLRLPRAPRFEGGP